MENNLVLPAVLLVTCILLFINVTVPTGLLKRLVKFLGSISFTWYLVHNNIGFSLITFFLPEGKTSLTLLFIPILVTIIIAILIEILSKECICKNE